MGYSQDPREKIEQVIIITFFLIISCYLGWWAFELLTHL